MGKEKQADGAGGAVAPGKGGLRHCGLENGPLRPRSCPVGPRGTTGAFKDLAATEALRTGARANPSLAPSTV